jgi:predicted nucleotidyltransferase
MAPPPRHAAFVENALPHFQSDSRVVGVAAAGSWITDSMDEHSDVDLVIALRPESFLEVMAERHAIAARLGALLTAFTGEHVGEPRLLICLYGPPLLHVDLKFTAVDDLRKRVEDPVVLWERDGAITRALAGSQPAWPQPDPQWIEDRFWVWVHYVGAKVVRGEWFEAIDSLAFIRSKVLASLAALAEAKDARGVRHVERDLGAYVDGLRKTIPTHDPRSCASALRATVEQYRALRERLATPGLVRRESAERAALAYLDAVLPDA